MSSSWLALGERWPPPTRGRSRPALTLLAATALSAGALLAAPVAGAAAAVAAAAPANIPSTGPATAAAAGARSVGGTPLLRRAHRRSSPWVVPAEDPRAAWLAEDLSVDDELVVGGGGVGGGRGGPAVAGPRGLLTSAGRPLQLGTAAASATATPPPVKADAAFPSTPAGASGASLAKFVASRPSVDTIVDGQCWHHASALPLLLRRLGALPAAWASPSVRARGGAPGTAAAADAAAALPVSATPARTYVCVTANRGEQRRVQGAMAGAVATVAAAATPGGGSRDNGGGVSLIYCLGWQLEAADTDAADVVRRVGEQGGLGGTDGDGVCIAGLHPRGKGRAVAVVAPRGLDDREFGQAYRRARSGGGRVRWLLTERGGRRGGLQAFQLF